MSVDNTTNTSTENGIDKLTKPQLVEYVNNVIHKFNEQVTNYNTLYTEYQKLLEIVNTPTKENKAVYTDDHILEMDQRIDSLQEQLKESLESKDLITKQLEEAIKEISRLNNLITDSDNNIDAKNLEIENLKTEIQNIKLEQSKNPTNLKSINNLDRTVTNSVQIYEIFGYENRVDNTFDYGGREFTIAKVHVRLLDKTFSWTIDFLGSELYKSERISRMVTMDEAQNDHFVKLIKNNTLFNAIKLMLDIPDKFNPKIFFDSVLYKIGEEIKD